MNKSVKTREKQKKAPTPEERLAQALVPKDEQPYPVPGNWVWVRLGAINNYKGKSINPLSKPDIIFELYSVPSLSLDFPDVINGAEIGSAKQVVKKDDVLLCKINPRINRVWIVSAHTDNILVASSEWIIVRNDDIYGQYLMWCFQSNYFREYMLSNVSGVGGSLMRAQPKYVENYPIPLPPLAEQRRIVGRIEGLFAKLDRAKALVQSALDCFETRKAAILHKAFTGELTARWREKNGVGLDSWNDKSLNELCSSFQYGTSKKSEQTGDVVVIRMGNLQNGEIEWDNLAYTTDEADISKYSLSKGDVLFNRTNSPDLVGKTSIYRGEIPAIFAGYLIRINYKECLNGYYLNYVMNSQMAKEYCSVVKSDGVNQSNINAKKLAAFTIPLPTFPEQQEIVRILDKLFEKEQRACELCDVIEKIDHMKKAILARAFRSELGTNDSADESAL